MMSSRPQLCDLVNEHHSEYSSLTAAAAVVAKHSGSARSRFAGG
jgi:hypothetical protein